MKDTYFICILLLSLPPYLKCSLQLLNIPGSPEVGDGGAACGQADSTPPFLLCGPRGWTLAPAFHRQCQTPRACLSALLSVCSRLSPSNGSNFVNASQRVFPEPFPWAGPGLGWGHKGGG